MVAQVFYMEGMTVSLSIIIGWTIGGVAVSSYKAWKKEGISEVVHYILGGYAFSVASWMAGS